MEIKGAQIGGRIEVGNIVASAMTHPEVVAIRHMLAACDLLSMTRPVSRRELDQKLAAANLETVHKMTVRTVLHRHGLIDEERRVSAAASDRFANNPEWRALLPSLRHLELDEKLGNGGAIRMSELESAMDAHHFGTSARISVKSALGRLGGLIDDRKKVQASSIDDGDGIHPALKPHMADLRSLGLDQHILAGGKISGWDLDELMSDAVKKGHEKFRDTRNRILLKNALDAAGILKPHRFT